MDLGTLTATLGVDTSGLAKAEMAMNQFGTKASMSFGRVASAAFSLKAAIVAVVASFAISKLTSYITDAAHLAGRYDELGIAMNRAGANSGYTALQMMKLEQGLEKQGIGLIETRDSLTKMSATYLDLSKAVELSAAAQNVAVAAGKNSSETMENFIHVIQSGNVMMARQMGLNVQFEASYKEMEKTVGHALSEQEKMQARANAILKAAAGYQGLYTEAMRSAEKQFGTLTRYIDAYKISFGKAFQPAFLEIMRVKTEMYKKLAEVLSDPGARAGLRELSNTFIEFYGNVLNKIPEMVKWFSTLGDKIDTVKKFFKDWQDVIIALCAGAVLPALIGLIGLLTDAVIGLVAAIAGGTLLSFLVSLVALTQAVNPAVWVALAGALATFAGIKIYKALTDTGEGAESTAINIRHLGEETGKTLSVLKELTSGITIRTTTGSGVGLGKTIDQKLDVKSWAELDKMVEDGIIKYDTAAQKFVAIKQTLGEAPKGDEFDAQKLEEATKRITEAIDSANEAIVGITEGSYAQTLLNIDNEVKKYTAAGVEKAKIDKFVSLSKQKEQLSATKTVEDAIRDSEMTILGIKEGAYTQTMAEIRREAEENVKRGADRIKVEELVASKTLAIQLATNKELDEAIRESELNFIGYTQGTQAQELAKLSDDLEKLLNEKNADPVKVQELGYLRTAEIAKKTTKERLDAERDLYKDLRGYSGEYYGATVKLIQEQGLEYRKLGISITAVDAWMKEETLNAFIEMGKKSDEWRDGVSAAFAQLEKDAMSWGQAAYDVVMQFSQSSKETLSTFFFDAYKGELKSFADYWNSFWDAIAKKFFDICSDMLVNWIMTQMKMQTAASTSSGSGLLGGLISIIGNIFGRGTTGVGGGTTLSGVGNNISTGWNTGGFNLESAMSLGKYHGGGRVGYDYVPTMTIPASLFANATRLHGGLDPDEFPAILQRGERVSKKGESKEKTPVNLSITNIASPDLIDSYLSTSRGQNAILNIISAKSGTVKRSLRK